MRIPNVNYAHIFKSLKYLGSEKDLFKYPSVPLYPTKVCQKYDYIAIQVENDLLKILKRICRKL